LPIRSFRGVKRTRTCRLDGCDAKVEPGAAYCRAHTRTPEAVAFRRELQGAEAYLELAAEALDPDQVERSEAFHRFRQRAKHGRFDQLLEAPTRRMLEQAAAVEGFELELGALRYGLMRVLAEETDPTRMALALARLSNAGVRARLANGDVDGGAQSDQEADWLDRVSEAMLGFTLEGDDFQRSPVGRRAQYRQLQVADRWAEARRVRAAQEEASASQEANRRARVAERSERLGWGTPVWGDKPGQAPIAHLPVDGHEVGRASSPDALPMRDAAEPEPAFETDEDRDDAAHAQRIAEQRSAAVQRWEADRSTMAAGLVGSEREPEPRIARRGR